MMKNHPSRGGKNKNPAKKAVGTWPTREATQKAQAAEGDALAPVEIAESPHKHPTEIPTFLPSQHFG